jgi:type IV pilus assembly protein PilC
LSTTFRAGVPLVESLTAVGKSSGNLVFENAIYNIREEVTAGIQMHAAMRNTRLFPALALQMTEIGEESGSLDDLLEKVADHFEDSVDEQVSNLTTLLEPVIMVILGVLVGGMLVAMYLPIFKLGSVI